MNADLMNAATKIQASFRGHMARKQAEKEEKTKTENDISKEMEKLQSKVYIIGQMSTFQKCSLTCEINCCRVQPMWRKKNWMWTFRIRR